MKIRFSLVVVLLLSLARGASAQTVSTSFTSAIAGADLLVGARDTVTFSVSGTFVGTSVLEQFVGGNWTPLVTATGASSGSFVAEPFQAEITARYRYRVSAFTSGTVVTSLARTILPTLVSGRFIATGSAPAVTNTSANSCGTTAATLVGTDNAFKVTVGATSGTSCTVTFATAFVNAPSCTVSNETTAALARATSTTTTAILAGSFTAGDVLAGACLGR